jgi:trichothecene 3-O-acetyltransferase
MSAPQEIHIPLTAFDHIVPRAYFNGAFYFPLKSGVSPAEAFKFLHEALHRTFVHVPWLSGRVCAQSPDTPGWRPGQIEIRYKPVDINEPWPHQLKFKQLDDYDISYEELKDLGFPTDIFKDEDLAWRPFFADFNNDPEVFVAQANFIPGCCIITAAVCHLASDQTAFTEIFKLWADNCSALQRQSKQFVDLPPESSDRDLIERLWAKESTVKDAEQIDPMTWTAVGLVPGDMEHDPEISPVVPGKAPKILKATVFYVSPSKFTELQKATTKEAGVASGISGNDALCALIWRCLLRARSTARKANNNDVEDDGDDVAQLAMVGDARPNFASGLPPTFLGNITYLARSSLSLSTLTSSDTSIASVAATLRSSVESVDSAKLLEIYTLLRSMPDFDRFGKWKRARAPSLDGNDMEISSMILFPMASICFGEGIFGNKGMPEAMRPLMEGVNQFTYLCMVIPRNRNGGVEFVANMSDQEKEFLMEDEEFGNYAMALN